MSDKSEIDDLASQMVESELEEQDLCRKVKDIVQRKAYTKRSVLGGPLKKNFSFVQDQEGNSSEDNQESIDLIQTFGLSVNVFQSANIVKKETTI